MFPLDLPAVSLLLTFPWSRATPSSRLALALGLSPISFLGLSPPTLVSSLPPSPSFCLQMTSSVHNGYSEALMMEAWLSAEQSALVRASRAGRRGKNQLFCQVGSWSQATMTDDTGKHSAGAVSWFWSHNCAHRWGAQPLPLGSGRFPQPLLLSLQGLGLERALQAETKA